MVLTMTTPIKLETKLGNVWLIPTSGTHILVDFGHNLNVEHEGPGNSDRRGPLVAHGVTVWGSMHLHLHQDGLFGLGPDNGEPPYHYLYLSRGMGADASPAARKLVLNTVLPLVQQWVNSNTEILGEAEKTDRAKRVARLRNLIAEHERAITLLQAEVGALVAN